MRCSYPVLYCFSIFYKECFLPIYIIHSSNISFSLTPLKAPLWPDIPCVPSRYAQKKSIHTVVYPFVSQHSYKDSGLLEDASAALNCSGLALAERYYHFQNINLDQRKPKEATRTEMGSCTFSL